MWSTSPRTIKPSARGELEITDVNNAYLEARRPACRAARAAAMPGSTPAPTTACIDASSFVRTIEHRQGIKIACPEEIGVEWGG